MIRAVIDTNVLVLGLLPPAGNEALILFAIYQGLLHPCFSQGSKRGKFEMTDATDDDDAHRRLIDILTEALQKAGAEGITKQDVLPAVADFLTFMALIMADEAGVRAVMQRMEGRIEDWKAGRFPDRFGRA